MKKVTIGEIMIEVVGDEFPDLSYLDQFENSGDPILRVNHKANQERKQAYNEAKWWCIGIRASANIDIHQDDKHRTTHSISSPGLWGIESDSDKSYFEEVAREELNQLYHDLTALNVDVSDFKWHGDEAIKKAEW